MLARPECDQTSWSSPAYCTLVLATHILPTISPAHTLADRARLARHFPLWFLLPLSLCTHTLPRSRAIFAGSERKLGIYTHTHSQGKLTLALALPPSPAHPVLHRTGLVLLLALAPLRTHSPSLPVTHRTRLALHLEGEVAPGLTPRPPPHSQSEAGSTLPPLALCCPLPVCTPLHGDTALHLPPLPASLGTPPTANPYSRVEVGAPP